MKGTRKMRRILTVVLLSILALAAVTGCASPATDLPGAAQENRK